MASFLLTSKSKFSSLVRNTSCLSSLLFLVACQTDTEEVLDQPVEVLYTQAHEHFREQSYTKAAKGFVDVERQHPYSNWALKAQLMSSYCYYQAKRYDDAIDGFKSFVQLHPGHQDVAYAYYMIGLCYYEQIPIVERDQEPTTKALETFQEVVSRFKTSIYAKDAALKISLIQDHLAAKEMSVGRFYLKKKSYIAALNRFKLVIQDYQTSSQIQEALFRATEISMMLGLKGEAQKYASVLGHNYPNSSWYKEAFSLVKSEPVSVFVSEPKKETPKSKK